MVCAQADRSGRTHLAATSTLELLVESIGLPLHTHTPTHLCLCHECVLVPLKLPAVCLLLATDGQHVGHNDQPAGGRGGNTTVMRVAVLVMSCGGATDWVQQLSMIVGVKQLR